MLEVSNWSATALQVANDFAKEYSLTSFSMPQIKLYGCCPENYERAERVKELSQKTGHSAGVSVLAYLLNQDIDISPMIAFSLKEQFVEAKLALDCGLSI